MTEIDSAAVVYDGAVTLDRACEFLGIKRTSIYRLMNTGQLAWAKVAGRRVVPVAALRRLLADGLYMSGDDR